MATGPGLAVLRPVVEAMPGLGVLRDGQKWVALAMPGYALAAAGSVVTVRRRRPAAVAAVACAAVLVVLPDLAWGVWGKVTAVRYPPGWAAAAAAINADPRPVAVLPAGSMRQFSWAGPAPVLDPLPRWVRADVLTTGDLTISGQTVPGEGGRARAVQELLLAGAPADRLPGPASGGWLPNSAAEAKWVMRQRHSRRCQLSTETARSPIYRVDGQSPGATAGQRRAAVAAHLGWLAVLIFGAAGMAGTTIRAWPSTRKPPPSS